MHQDSDQRRSITRAAFFLAAALLVVPAGLAASTSTYSPTLGVNITTDRLTYSCNPSCQPQFNVTNFNSTVNQSIDVTVFNAFNQDQAVDVTSIEEKTTGTWGSVGTQQGDAFVLTNHPFFNISSENPYQFRLTVNASEDTWSKWDLIIQVDSGVKQNVTLDPFINTISLHDPDNDTVLTDSTPTFNYSFSSQNSSLNASVVVDNQLDPVYNWTNASNDTFHAVNSTQVLSDGKHFWEVWVDSDGDESRESAERSENRTFTVDAEAPKITTKTPADGAFLSGTVDVNATATDAGTSVDFFQYRWVNDSDMWLNRSAVTDWRALNDSGFDTDTIRDDLYTLMFRANDSTGNMNASVNISNVMVDNTQPNGTDNLNLTHDNYTGSFFGLSPLLTGRIGNFSAAGINWTGYDTARELIDDNTDNVSSGVDRFANAFDFMARNRSFNTSTQSLNEWSQEWIVVNASVNASHSRPNISHASLASDHQYRFALRVEDRAGNRRFSQKKVNLTLDTTPPVLADRPNGTVHVEPFQWTNQESLSLESMVTDLAGVNATKNHSLPDAINVTFWNTTGTVFPSVSLSPSSGVATTVTVTSGTVSNLQNLTWYNVTVNATDALGNRNTSINWSFRTDFNTPNMTALSDDKVFNSPIRHGEWDRDNVTVEIDCSDASGESGMDAVSTDTTGWVYSVPGNVTVTRNGNATETLRCRDVAGNVNSSRTQQIAIDRNAPSFSEENPEDGDGVSTTSPNISIKYEDGESGLNLSDGLNLSGSVENIYNFTIEQTSVEDDANWGNRLVWYDAGEFNGGDGLSNGENYDVDVRVCDRVATGFDDAAHCETESWEFDVAEETTQTQNNQQSSGSGAGTQLTSTLKIVESPNTVTLPLRRFKAFNVTVENNGSANLVGIDTTFDVPNIDAAVTPADVNMDANDTQVFTVNLTPTSDTEDGFFGGTLTVEADGGTSASASVNVSVVAAEANLKIVDAPTALNVTRGNGTQFAVKITNNGEVAADNVEFQFDAGNLTSAVLTDMANISVDETVFANVSVVATAQDSIDEYRTRFQATHPSGNRSRIIQIKVQPESRDAEQEIEQEQQRLERQANRFAKQNESEAADIQSLLQQAQQALDRGDYARASRLQDQARSRLPSDLSGGGGIPWLWIGLVIFLVIIGVVAYLVIPDDKMPYPALGDLADRDGRRGGGGRTQGYRSDYPGGDEQRGRDQGQAKRQVSGSDDQRQDEGRRQRGQQEQGYQYRVEEQSFGDKVRKTLSSAKEKGKQHKERAQQKVKRGRGQRGEQQGERSRPAERGGQGGGRQQDRRGGDRLEHDSEPRVTKKKIRFEDEKDR